MRNWKFILVLVTVAFILGGCSISFKNAKKYEVSFDTDGGSAIQSQSVEDGKLAKRPSTDPVKEGYYFIEWAYLNESYDFSSPVHSNLVLVAKYSESNEDTEELIVKFDTDGGNTIPNQIVKKGNTAEQPSDPIKDGYKFIEWQLNAKKYDFETLVNDNIVLKAKWEKAEGKKYTISFDTDGGSAVANQLVVEGGKVSKPKDPQKENYGFVDWMLNDLAYDFNSIVSNDMTLKAKWEQYKKYQSNSVSFTHCYRVNSSDEASSIVADYVTTGDKITCSISFETYSVDVVTNIWLDLSYGNGLKLVKTNLSNDDKLIKEDKTHKIKLNKPSSVGEDIIDFIFEVVNISNSNELFIQASNIKFETQDRKFYYTDNSKVTVDSIWDAPSSVFQKYVMNAVGLSHCYIRDSIDAYGYQIANYVSKGDKFVCGVGFETYATDLISDIQFELHVGNGIKIIETKLPYLDKYTRKGNLYTIKINKPTSVGDNVIDFAFEVTNDLNNVYIHVDNIRFVTTDKRFYYVDNDSAKISPVWDAPDSAYQKYSSNAMGLEHCYKKGTSNLASNLNVNDEIECHMVFETYSGDDVLNAKYTLNYGSGLTLLNFSADDHTIINNASEFKVTLKKASSCSNIGTFIFKINDISNSNELYLEAKNTKFITKDKKFYFVDDSRIGLQG